MILIVDRLDENGKVTSKIVPSDMEYVIKRILEKYEYAEERTYIQSSSRWAVAQVCREMRGDI